MTLLSRSVTCTHIKPQMTHKPFRRTSALNMKLINICLTVLVCINAVHSAAMREGSEDLLRFLKDAFELNLPLEHTDPTQLSEMDLATEKSLDPVHPTDPTAECKAPEIVNSADFPNTTPKPNLVDLADVAEERSVESSNSDSGLAERTSTEDSREGDGDKRLQPRTALTDIHKALQLHYENSAESMSMDRTDMDTDVTEGSNKNVLIGDMVEDVSSEEMDRHEEKGRYRPPRTQKMLEKHSSVVTDTGKQNLDFMKEMEPIIQSLASRINLKDQTGKPRDIDKHQQESRRRAMDLDSPEFVDTPDRADLYADSEEDGGGRGTRTQTQISGSKVKLNYAANQDTLDNSRELTDLIPGCTETSVEHPVEENSSLDAPNVDRKIQKDTMMSYQNQLRKICPTKRVQTSNNPRAQLDLDQKE